MPIDPRSPVIVGVGQTQQRLEDPKEALEPVALLAQAVSAADSDTGARRSLVADADTVAVAEIISWPYPDPGATLGAMLGISPATTIVSTVGGNSPQMLVNRLATGIVEGRHEIAIVAGAECVYTRWRARRAEPKAWLPWPEHREARCANVWGDTRAGSSQYEMAHWALAPTQVYPLFETAIRGALGRTIDEHRSAVGALWAEFAAVAAGNEHAWTRTAYSADEIVDASSDNRLVTAPYTKRMCANIDVDQAAAVLLCSYEAAGAAGVPDERMVFPHAGADAHDHFFFSERATLSDSVAIGATVHAALDAAALTVDDIARFDLYSCFPSAVQIAMRSIGLEGRAAGDDRQLTVTGGLGFAGGPGNNYVTHSIAAMVEACRRDPDSVGLVTALGWYVTKHSTGVYSTRPPERFVAVDPEITQRAVDASPKRATAGSYAGPATVEASAVVIERDGSASVGILSARTPDGRRALANTRDQTLMQAMVDEAWEGRDVEIRTADDVNHVVV
jgi:acetyl-CoA C-acetyltransferase